MSLFFVDNGSELTFEQIKSLGIECFNFRYTLNDKVLDFDDKFDYDKFYSKFKKGVCVGLYSYSAQDYVDIFEPCLQQDDIIYICGSQDVAFNENLYKARDILTDKYPDRSRRSASGSHGNRRPQCCRRRERRCGWHPLQRRFAGQ